MRILVAEDDVALSEALRFSLTQAGHAVDQVVNGVEADEALPPLFIVTRLEHGA